MAVWVGVTVAGGWLWGGVTGRVGLAVVTTGVCVGLTVGGGTVGAEVGVGATVVGAGVVGDGVGGGVGGMHWPLRGFLMQGG